MRRLDLYACMNTEEDAIQWCRDKSILPRSMLCDICSNQMREEGSEGIDSKMWGCRRTIDGKRHQVRKSIRAGSFFADANLSLATILRLLYEWSRCVPIEETAFQLKVHKDTVGLWFSRFRELIEWNKDNSPSEKIGGEGTIVEVDECQIGRRKHHRGRAPKTRWVFGGIVRGSAGHNCFIDVV